jgi:hypothetical protein
MLIVLQLNFNPLIIIPLSGVIIGIISVCLYLNNSSQSNIHNDITPTVKNKSLKGNKSLQLNYKDSIKDEHKLLTKYRKIKTAESKLNKLLDKDDHTNAIWF